MAFQILNGEQTFLDGNGDPLGLGLVYMYIVGTTTPKESWQDSSGTTVNTNPIILDAAGRCRIWGTGQYRQIVLDVNGNLQWDQIVGGGSLGTPSGFVYASDYGLRSGSGDCQAIQAAINYAATLPNGATVYLGPGPITLPSSCEINWPANANGVNLKGDGPYTTVITVNGDLTQDLLDLTAGNLAHCQIRDLGFNCTGIGTGGALIHFADCYAAHVENVRVAGGFWDGVQIGGGSNQYLCTIRDLICPASSSANACIVIGDDTNGLAQGIYIDTCKLAQSAFGIYVRNGSGISISDTECLNHSEDGFITSPALGETAENITISNFLSDTCGQAAVNIGSSAGIVRFISIVGGSFNNSLNGIVIATSPQLDNISIIGSNIHVNRQSAIINYGANSVQISNCMMAGNGHDAPNTYDAVVIMGGCILNGIDNNIIGASYGFPAAHRYGIALRDTVDYCTVIANKTGGPSGTAGINNGSSGAHNLVLNNVGT